MKIKKAITSFLLLAFCAVFSAPMAGNAASDTSSESLQDFIKSTKEIKASYTYPSMKLTYNGSGKSMLAAHTPIIIRSSQTISTASIKSGDNVNFTIVNDVKDDSGNILIKSGTPVSAQIAFAKSKDKIGRSGELNITDFHTTAVDGSYVPLSGSVSSKSDDKFIFTIIISVLICPLFLLLEGDEAQLNAGATKTVYPVTNTYINTLGL